MLSLILYGRNDSHGYNLHKRAAISLNCIAELVEPEEDEIIFVDYNTPDELPTFLETIADTLTERAKRAIRIIRVRPEFHRRYVSITNLVALESQSRNIAIRRANPDNRWILSTNTDMIFVPTRDGESLGDICRGLADGFYHLPRFELPEGFWERSNRLDPIGMIHRLQQYGRRFHLNEVVYGGFDNVYEAPGDFQLFLRDDLYRIGGFDETMLRGWHVDSNTARRMKLLRGSVDSLFPALAGYHCGHTRQATSLHGARRTENSIDTYVRDIRSPCWTTEDEWGAPAESFEEFRLTECRTLQYFAGLSRAVAAEGPVFSEATYNETTFSAEGFDAAHVLPHLGDVVFNIAPNRTLFFVGSDRELIEGFERLVSSAPMMARLFVCGEQGSPGDDFSSAALNLEDGLARADLVVIQYPNARTVAPAARADLEWFAQHALERLIEIERGREKAARRRVVVVNGMHTPLQRLISASLDAASSPFSARIRQGRVVDEYWDTHPIVTPDSQDFSTLEAVGRNRAFAATELAALRKALTAAGRAEEFGWERAAIELIALAPHTDFIIKRLGASPEAAHDAAESARAKVLEASERCAKAPILVPPRVGVSNRLCSGADWEDSDWLKLATRYFGERAYTTTTRSRWLWERVSLLLELRRRVPPDNRPWIICLGDRPDVLAAMAAHMGYRVAYSSVDSLLGGTATESWLDILRLQELALPSSLIPLDQAPPDRHFVAVLAPNACLFNRERDRPQRVMEKLAPYMAPDAHSGMSSLVHLNNNKGGGALSQMEFAGAADKDGLLEKMGLAPDADIDAQIPLDAVVRFAPDDRSCEYGPGLSFGFGPDALVSIGMLWGRFPRMDDSTVSLLNTRRRWPASNAITVGRLERDLKPAAQPGFSLSNASSPDSEPASSFVKTLQARVHVYPAVFSNLRRNLLQSVVSNDVVSRAGSQIVLGSGQDGRVRFAIPIADFFPDRCLIHLTASGAEALPLAVYVGKRGIAQGAVEGYGNGIKLGFALTESLGDGMVVLDFAASKLEIKALLVCREAGTASVLAGAL